MTDTEATQATERTQETQEEEQVSKYMLLNHLFKFVRQSTPPINSVLAGYFSKVLTLLLSRKQNQLIPYLFDTSNDAIDCMLNHIY